jgi:hypothetical protein
MGDRGSSARPYAALHSADLYGTTKVKSRKNAGANSLPEPTEKAGQRCNLRMRQKKILHLFQSCRGFKG